MQLFIQNTIIFVKNIHLRYLTEFASGNSMIKKLPTNPFSHHFHHFTMLQKMMNASVHPYRNQSTDLNCNSMDWFLQKFNIGLIWVKGFQNIIGALQDMLKKG